MNAFVRRDLAEEPEASNRADRPRGTPRDVRDDTAANDADPFTRKSGRDSLIAREPRRRHHLVDLRDSGEQRTLAFEHGRNARCRAHHPRRSRRRTQSGNRASNSTARHGVEHAVAPALRGETPRALRRRFRAAADAAVGMRQRHPRTENPVIVQRQQRGGPNGASLREPINAQKVPAVQMHDVGPDVRDDVAECLIDLGVAVVKGERSPGPRQIERHAVDGIAERGVDIDARCARRLVDRLDGNNSRLVSEAEEAVGQPLDEGLDTADEARREVRRCEDDLHGSARGQRSDGDYSRTAGAHR